MTTPPGAPEKPAGATGAAPRPDHPRCPECPATWEHGHPNKMFCGDPCRDAYTSRLDKRGRQLAPYAMASYATRGGTRGDHVTGKRARQDAEFLMRLWKEEDAEAGRLSVTEYMALRYAKGFERK